MESSDLDAKFMVASRIEKLYGGKVYLGLRIPDADSGTRQNIDMVLVTKGEVLEISVKNFSCILGIDVDGTWVCTSDGKHKTESSVPITEMVCIREGAGFMEKKVAASVEGVLQWQPRRERGGGEALQLRVLCFSMDLRWKDDSIM